MWVKLANGAGDNGNAYWSVDQISFLSVWESDGTHYYVIINGNTEYQLTAAYSTQAAAQASLDAFAEQLGVVTSPA